MPSIEYEGRLGHRSPPRPDPEPLCDHWFVRGVFTDIAADGDGPLFQMIRCRTADLIRVALPGANPYAMV